jgi:hypothetical protein
MKLALWMNDGLWRSGVEIWNRNSRILELAQNFGRPFLIGRDRQTYHWKALGEYYPKIRVRARTDASFLLNEQNQVSGNTEWRFSTPSLPVREKAPL